METNCIVLKSGLYAVDYAYNVCTGAITTVPWSAFDWIGFWLCMLILVLLVVVAPAFWIWLNWKVWRFRWRYMRNR